MAEPTFADSFVGTYTAMQANARANEQAEQQRAQALAQQHWEESANDIAERRQDLAEQQFAAEQSPTSPQNRRADTAAKAQQSLAERQQTENEQGNRRLDIAQQNSDAAIIDKALGAHRQGASPAEVAAGMPSYLQDRFKTAVIQSGLADYNQRLNDRQLEIYNDLKNQQSTTTAPPAAAPSAPNPADPFGLGNAASMFGAQPAQPTQAPSAPQTGAPMPAESPEITEGKLHAKAMVQAQKELEAAGIHMPDPANWQSWEHPAFTEQKRQDAAKDDLMRARVQLANSQSDRLKIQAQLAPELAQARIASESTIATARKDMVGIARSRADWQKYYQNELLDDRSLMRDIQQQNADTRSQHENAYERLGTDRNDIARAKNARQFASTMLQATNREYGALQKQAAMVHNKLITYQGLMAPAMTPEGQFNAAYLPKPVPGQNGMTYAQLDKLVTSLRVEEDAANPTSLAHRMNDVQTKALTLSTAMDPIQTPGIDVTPITGSGNRARPPAPRTGAIGTLGARPVTAGAGAGSGRPTTGRGKVDSFLDNLIK